MTKLISFILVFISLISKAQTINRCSLGPISSETQRIRNSQVQEIVEKYLSENHNNPNLKVAVEKIRIPVVVHVIRNTPSEEIGGTNISNDQIYSQIKVLNEDYNKIEGTNGYNNSPVGANMQMEFFLANIDPNGRPTTGINRVYNSKKSYSLAEGSNDISFLSSLSYWDSDRYLNIWVANLSNNYLGRSEFPGAAIDGLEVEDPPKNIDGVIISYEAFGRQIGSANSGLYSYGRTATHEIGHWFGLLHTWGDDFCASDYVNDTPPTEGPDFLSDCRELYSYCAGQRSKNMIENYLDYSPDICMNIFTIGQKERVRAILNLSKARSKLVANSQLFLPVSKFDVKLISNPSSSLKAQILMPDFGDFSVTVFSIGGLLILNKEYKNSLSTIVEFPKSQIGQGLFIVLFKNGNTIINKRVIVF